MKKGKFIVFEGIDGAGKTTMIDRACKFLRDSDIRLYQIKFPTDATSSFQSAAKDPLARALANFADQRECLYSIQKALETGLHILSDRFAPSIYAYQGIYPLTDCNHKTIKTLDDLIFNGFKPDYIFLFDLPVEVAADRVEERDGLELGTIDENEVCAMSCSIDMYHDLARQDPDRYIIIDANKDVDEVWQQVKAELEKIFNLK